MKDEEYIADVPASAFLHAERKNPYGSVPGLDDEELADPDELERQVMLAEWGPVMALPVKARKASVQPTVDESFGLDFGAFATVDFERTTPEFDKARYKAEKLQEELRNVLILLGVVKERLPGRAKNQVLKYLQAGVIGLPHITNEDMLAVAKLYLRARKMQEEIAQLRKLSWERRQKAAVAWLEA